MLLYVLVFLMYLSLEAAAIRLRIGWLSLVNIISTTLNVFTGGSYTETFCARTGRNIRDAAQPVWLWNAIGFVLDCTFIWRERNHCAASLNRKIKNELPKSPS